MTTVLDVTDASFAAEVLDESQARPVVVDFWAEWCAPCRTLGPVLEALAQEKGGAFRLAKLDVDRNPAVAQQFQVMGIPAVKAFVDGRLVDEFTGALPEADVRAWLDGFLPSPADDLAAEAAALVAAGDRDGAEERYRRALAEEPRNPAAAVGLAVLLIDRGALEEAEELVTPLLPDAGAERALAAITVRTWAELEGTDDLAEARRRAAAGEWEAALDALMAQVPQVPEAREAILQVFAVLGDGHPLTRTYRSKLAAALF